MPWPRPVLLLLWSLAFIAFVAFVAVEAVGEPTVFAPELALPARYRIVEVDGEWAKKTKKAKKAKKKKKAKKRKARPGPPPRWMDAMDGLVEGRMRWIAPHEGESIDVVIIDSGCSSNPRSFVENDRDAPGVDRVSHGSVIHALLKRLMPYARYTCWKVFGDALRTSKLERFFAALEAVEPYCLGRKCVVNLSWQTHINPEMNAVILRLLKNENTTIVAAAGNLGESPGAGEADACKFTPAGVPGVVVAGATSPNTDVVAPFSKIGRCVTEFAPGWGITFQGRKLYGTSFSTAVVTAERAHEKQFDVFGGRRKIAGFAPSLAVNAAELVAITTRDLVYFL